MGAVIKFLSKLSTTVPNSPPNKQSNNVMSTTQMRGWMFPRNKAEHHNANNKKNGTPNGSQTSEPRMKQIAEPKISSTKIAAHTN
jgi:hypothetical protein